MQTAPLPPSQLIMADKLKKKQLEAIQVVKDRIKQWIYFESDYEILLECLNSLPRKVTANIMVPIGKVAYMQGQLYRTNEVLAFLGDNWFAERTAYQVCCIVERRLQDIRKELERERKNLDDINSQYCMTTKIHNLDQDIIEIQEEYDPVKEEEWKRSRWEQKDVTEDREKKNDREIDSQLFERLDQLEKEEEQEMLLKESREVEARKSFRRRILETSTELMKIDVKNDSNMNERGKGRVDELTGDMNPLTTIYFKHSEQSEISSSCELHSNDAVTQYLNPGDIYKKVTADSLPGKLADDTGEVQHNLQKCVHFESHATPHVNVPTPPAFSGVIKERNPIATANQGAAMEFKESRRETVSKFKLSRMT